MLSSLRQDIGSIARNNSPSTGDTAGPPSNEGTRPVPVASYAGPRLTPLPPQTAPIVVVLNAPERRTDATPRTKRLSGGWAIVAEAIGVALLLAALVYGPPYHTCRQMKERGLFYYGTTVGTCVRDDVSRKVDAVEALFQGGLSRL